MSSRTERSGVKDLENTHWIRLRGCTRDSSLRFASLWMTKECSEWQKNVLNDKKNVLNDNAIWHILWNIPLAPFARGIHPRIIHHKSNIIHHKSNIIHHKSNIIHHKSNINHHEKRTLEQNPEHCHYCIDRYCHHLWCHLLHGSVKKRERASFHNWPSLLG